MSRVLLFSRDPGGANTVIPLVGPLLARGDQLCLYGKDFSLEKYAQAGLAATGIMSELSSVSLEEVKRFLVKISPDIIITGTSADDFTEKYIWKASEELEIPSLAILDQWGNYGLRFSNHGVDDVISYEKDSCHPYLPTRIVVMDDYAREEMIAEGLPPERLVVCGQPYFETVLSHGSDVVEQSKFSSSYDCSGNDFVVVFASEPITTTYGKDAINYWGYTEQTILRSLVNGLEILAAESCRSIVLLIKPHPKETPGHLSEIAKNCSLVRCVIEQETSPWQLIGRADLICGMSSMFLIESIVLGRPVLSIQIGLCRKDPFILASRGIVRTVVTEEDLADRLEKFLTRGDTEIPRMEIIGNPVARIMTEMESLLCQN